MADIKVQGGVTQAPVKTLKGPAGPAKLSRDGMGIAAGAMHNRGTSSSIKHNQMLPEPEGLGDATSMQTLSRTAMKQMSDDLSVGAKGEGKTFDLAMVISSHIEMAHQGDDASAGMMDNLKISMSDNDFAVRAKLAAKLEQTQQVSNRLSGLLNDTSKMSDREGKADSIAEQFDKLHPNVKVTGLKLGPAGEDDIARKMAAISCMVSSRGATPQNGELNIASIYLAATKLFTDKNIMMNDVKMNVNLNTSPVQNAQKMQLASMVNKNIVHE